MNTRKDESGLILIVALLSVALMIFGYVVINSIAKSREAEQVKDSATEAFDSAQDSIDAVKNVKDKAEDLLTN